jgi:hypothetical protein
MTTKRTGRTTEPAGTLTDYRGMESPRCGAAGAPGHSSRRGARARLRQMFIAARRQGKPSNKCRSPTTTPARPSSRCGRSDEVLPAV